MGFLKTLFELSRSSPNPAIRADEKYDKLINCPFCSGRGRLIIEKFMGGISLDGSHVDWTYENYCPNWMEVVGELEVPSEDDEKLVHSGPCPYCRGTGVAYAWFEQVRASTESCSRCRGTGEITERIKLNVGMGERQAQCPTCSGAGVLGTRPYEVAHIRTIGGLKSRGRRVDDIQDENPTYLDRTITGKNREFYSKHEVRKPGEEERRKGEDEAYKRRVAERSLADKKLRKKQATKRALYGGVRGALWGWVIFGFGGCFMRAAQSHYREAFEVFGAYIREGIAGLFIGLVVGMIYGILKTNK